MFLLHLLLFVRLFFCGFLLSKKGGFRVAQQWIYLNEKVALFVFFFFHTMMYDMTDAYSELVLYV